MIIETDWLNNVTLHDDGRVAIIRSNPRDGTFLYLTLTEKEQEALRRVLDSGARTQ